MTSQERRTNFVITSSFFKRKFFLPPDTHEGMIFNLFSRPISVEPQDDKVLYFAVGELLTTTSLNPSAFSRNACAKSSKVFWRLKKEMSCGVMWSDETWLDLVKCGEMWCDVVRCYVMWWDVVVVEPPELGNFSIKLRFTIFRGRFAACFCENHMPPFNLVAQASMGWILKIDSIHHDAPQGERKWIPWWQCSCEVRMANPSNCHP